MAKKPQSQARQTDETDDQTTPDLAELQRELAAARAQSSHWQAQAQSFEAEKIKAQEAQMSEAERRVVAELRGCETNIASMESEAETVEAQIAALADEPGHGKEVAALTRKLTQIDSRLTLEGERKNALESAREQAKAAPRPQAQPQGGEVLADGRPLSAFSPATQAWFRDHKQCFSDPRYLRKAIRVAEDVVMDEGIKPETTEYYARVSELLADDNGTTLAPARQEDDARSTTTEEDGEEIAYEPARRQAPAAGPGAMAAVVARPSRQTPTGSGTRQAGRQPLLSAEQREVADSIYSHIKSPAERYKHYADMDQVMRERQPGHFSATGGVN